MKTKNLTITGQVQGVGFRPFIFRLAQEHQLNGWVQNRTGQVELIIQGDEKNINDFEKNIVLKKPPLAQPEISNSEYCETEIFNEFSILKSEKEKNADIHIPPDFFTCDDCLEELTNPKERRYRYPFINCTQCGPRYTLIESLPYDRPNTSMKDFPLCEACNQEYTNIYDRRFHAQPLACSTCGPSLSFSSDEKTITGNEFSIAAALEALSLGKIIAVKGVGGYHLMCNALDAKAVQQLRDRKHRPDKPFAVLFPWQGKDGTDAVLKYLNPDEEELKQLTHPSRSIVLIKAKPHCQLAENINPGINEIGAMLPYSPLHFLLSREFSQPLVATSANFTGEPVITDNEEAEQRLASIVDAFVHHNRPILRPADDSVVRIINKQPHYIRLGRGVAPLEKILSFKLQQPVLAVGGHMKNTIALAWNNRIVVSPHIGELNTLRSMNVFQQAIEDLQALYQIKIQHILCDAHPDYASSRWAKNFSNENNFPLTQVYHHHAHAAVLAGEYPDKNKWLVFTWDGTGYGDDDSIWGGETLFGMPGHWKRVAHFKPFSLIGGDKASLQPWRSAAAMAWACDVDWQPQQATQKNINIDLARQVWQNTSMLVKTTAVGRIFDAAAAFIMQKNICSFDGQAPMMLEQIADQLDTKYAVDLKIETIENDCLEIDWSHLIPKLIDENTDATKRSNIFHSSLAMNLVQQAQLMREKYGDFTIGLSGGVFQNKLLTEFVINQLQQNNFKVHTTKDIPCNDAGISYGQVINTFFNTHDDR